MIYLIIGLTVFFFLLYFVIMLLYPEWVGISGEDTKRDLEAHRETKVDSTAEDSQKRN